MGLRIGQKHARRLSMTSLIDVIFLLLLFFMLSSTFSRYGAVELIASAQGQGTPSTEKPLFLRVQREAMSLNGRAVILDDLVQTALGADQSDGSEPVLLLLSLGDDVSAQRLVDVLAVIKQQPRLAVSVLG